MPRKAAATQIIDETAADAVPNQAGFVDEDMTDAEKLQAALGGYDGAGLAKVYQVDEKSQKLAYITQCDPREFLDAGEQMLREEYGPGTYEVRVYQDGRVLHRGRVKIAAPIQRRPSLSPIGESYRSPSRDPVPTDRTPDMLVAMQQMMAQMADRIAAAIPRPPSMMEQIQMLGALRQAMGPSDSGGGNMQNFVAMLQVAKELVANPGDTNELSALVQLAKPFAETLAAKAQAQFSQPGPVDRPGQPAFAGVPAQADQSAMVRAFVGSLVSHASANADVDPIADEILASVPPAALDEFLGAADWFQRLSALEPSVSAHAAWFTRLHTALTTVDESGDDGGSLPPAA